MSEWLGTEQLAVTAGAGAGKTTMLANRYVHHVMVDKLSPLQIVAVTFTEAAASELRSRVRLKMASVVGDEDDRIAELEAARICTFHALAASICRQHPTEAGVPADFTILDDVLGRLWTLERIDDALDALPPAMFSRVAYSRMRGCLRQLLQDPIAAEQALSWRVRHWKAEIRKAGERTAQQLIASSQWQSAGTFLASVSGAPGDLIEIARAQVVLGMQDFESNPRSLEALQRISQAKRQGGKKTSWAIDVAEVKDAIKIVRDVVNDALSEGIIGATPGLEDAVMIRQVSDLRRAYKLVKTSVDHAKRMERVLDYSDLEACALRALSFARVRHYYHERWKAFLIDEYQDTNRVQAQIIALLTEGGARQVIVGDENQSIYGFRRAEPALFREQRLAIESDGGACERLASNYRIHSSLLTKINSAFAKVFSGSDNTYEAQNPVRDYPEMETPFLRRLIVTIPESDAPAPNRQAQLRVEAIQLARMLQSMERDGTLVHDRGSNEYRPVQWGDMAILTATWKPLDAFSDALGSLGIPHVHAGGGSLMATREARDGYALLRFLADPADSLALAAVLRGPWCSMSDVDIWALSQIEAPSWWEALSSQGESETWHRPFELLNNLLDLHKVSPASRLLHVADCQTGLSAVLTNLPSGSRRLADWIGFCDLVRSLEQESLDVFGIVRALRRVDSVGMDGEPLVTVPRPALEAGNAVSLMTIHRAKGLEWPVVVVADMAAPPRSDSSWMHYDPEVGVALKGDGDLAPLLFRCLRQNKAERELQEIGRLAYVASTRARDFLILSSTAADSNERTLHAAIAPGLESAGVETESWIFNEADAIPPMPAVSVSSGAAPRVVIGPIVVPPTTLPVTGLHEYLICPKRFKYQYIDGHPGVGEGSSIPGRIGTLVHLAIQHALMEVDELRSFDRTLDREYLNAALTMANNFRTNKVFAKYRVDAARHEVAVSHQLNGFTLTGRIDLLGPEFVLDFKTGRKDDGSRYEIQLWLYGRITGRRELALAYLRDGEVISISLDDMADTERIVTDILTGIFDHQFPAQASVPACGTCRFNSICEDRHAEREMFAP